MSKRLVGKPSKEQKKYEIQLERLQKKINTLVPEIYSAIVLGLWEKLEGCTDEEKQDFIEDVCIKSQYYWTASCESGKDVVEMCSMLTNIDMRGETPFN